MRANCALVGRRPLRTVLGQLFGFIYVVLSGANAWKNKQKTKLIRFSLSSSLSLATNPIVTLSEAIDQKPIITSQPTFIQSKYGTQQLCYERHIFNRHVCRQNLTYWRCTQFAVLRCRARIKTHLDQMTLLNVEHNHPIITEGRKYGELKEFRRRQQQLESASSSSSAAAAAQSLVQQPPQSRFDGGVHQPQQLDADPEEIAFVLC